MNKKNIGFTLIELLVVIAIIGILSGLIIVSLGDATNQAKEAKIKSALDQLRPVAQLYYNKYGNYTSLATDPKVVNIYNEMVANGAQYDSNGATAGGAATPTAIGNIVESTDPLWCASAITPSGGCMCVDGTGKVKEVKTNVNGCDCASTACPN